MSFFQDVDTQATTFESGGGSFEPIPDNTRVLAVCESATDEVFYGDRYIKLAWRIAQPAEHANRIIFQKVKVYDLDPAKAQKAKQMLAAIAAIGGGKLFKVMQANNEAEPSDQALATLTNHPTVLLLGVWEMEIKGENKRGNWVRAVSAKQGAVPAPAPAPAPAATFNDDIPF